METMEEWASFDAFTLDSVTNGNALVAVGMHFFPKVTFPSPVAPSQFRAFLLDLQAAYLDVPYHSRVHAADVAQAAMWLIKDEPKFSGTSGIFLLAALAHDCGHFARTNAFLRSSGHPLVQRLGPTSTLEYFHLEISTALLNKHKIFPMVEEPLFRKLVLATDPAKKFPITDEEALVMKAADVNALARNFQVGLKWGERFVQEISDQQLEEHKLVLPVSDVVGSSADFAKDYVLPLFDALARVIPKVNNVVDTLVNIIK